MNARPDNRDSRVYAAAKKRWVVLFWLSQFGANWVSKLRWEDQKERGDAKSPPNKKVNGVRGVAVLRFEWQWNIPFRVPKYYVNVNNMAMETQLSLWEHGLFSALEERIGGN